MQTPGAIAMLTEFTHGHRIIYTDGRAPSPRHMKLCHGDSIGHWDGNTLVVDVRNQNGITNGDGRINMTGKRLDLAGDSFSDEVHVVERWTLLDEETLEYTATLDDPIMYLRPWTMVIVLTRVKDPGYELMEAACYEGERDSKRMVEIATQQR